MEIVQRTYCVGKISNETKRLVDVTKQAFFEGIKFAKKEFRLGDICPRNRRICRKKRI